MTMVTTSAMRATLIASAAGRHTLVSAGHALITSLIQNGTRIVWITEQSHSNTTLTSICLAFTR